MLWLVIFDVVVADIIVIVDGVDDFVGVFFASVFDDVGCIVDVWCF